MFSGTDYLDNETSAQSKYKIILSLVIAAFFDGLTVFVAGKSHTNLVAEPQFTWDVVAGQTFAFTCSWQVLKSNGNPENVEINYKLPLQLR